MTVFTAALAAETNSFAPGLTRMADFEAMGIRRGAESPHDPGAISLMLGAIRGCCEARGETLVEGLGAVAQPGGVVERETFDTLLGELLADLRAAMPVKAVVLILHGALIAEHVSDCEGEILACVRETVGPDVAVGAILDLHGHLTSAMMDAADVLVFFKEYPHTDTAERAREACELTLATARGEIAPVMRAAPCKTVGLWPTGDPPISDFVEDLRDAEKRDGVLSASFIHGFPWGDADGADASVLVLTDGDDQAAEREAGRLRDRFMAIRESAALKRVTFGQALARVSQGQLVIGDMSDNPGGGAPGDSTFLLEEVLQRKLTEVAIGALCDPEAVRACADAGVGTNVDLSIGGRSGEMSGKPMPVRGTVMAVRAEHHQTGFGTRMTFGQSAWLRLEGEIDLLLVSERQQTLGTDAFTGIGIDLASKRLVIVKSAQHYKAAFASLRATCIGVDTPGALSHDFARLPYRRRSLNYWPRCKLEVAA